MDFSKQIVPKTNKDGEANDCDKLESIYDKLLPMQLPTRAWLETDDVPYFLTPPVFSRFDTVHYYNSQTATSEEAVKEPEKKANALNTIGRTRRRRQGYTIFMNFNDEVVPQKPNPEAMNVLRLKMISERDYEDIKRVNIFLTPSLPNCVCNIYKKYLYRSLNILFYRFKQI